MEHGALANGQNSAKHVLEDPTYSSLFDQLFPPNKRPQNDTKGDQ